MASAGQAAALGPFTGGLNTKSDPSAIADNELSICENFEIDFDGSLKSRPPIVDTAHPMTLTATGNAVLLGTFQSGAVTYMIASDGNSSTWAFNGSTWNLITNSVSATAVVQFNGKLWLVAGPGSGQHGGSWDGNVTFTVDNNMPLGTSIAPYKGLLYVGAGAGSARLYYSNPITGTLWPASPNYVDVGYGDGESIVQLVPWNSVLLVFRSQSIWTYSWASTPAGAGANPVEPNIGLDNAFALDQLESVIYFIYEQRAYSFVNGRAQQLNDRVPLRAGNSANFHHPITVSIFGPRVLFSFYDTVFAYSTDTYSWSTWVTPTWGGLGKLIQRAGYADPYPIAYVMPSTVVASGGTRAVKMLQITDTVGSSSEAYTCTMQTRVFDYETPSQYKRLFWWGLDALFRSDMVATAVPVSYQSNVTWGQVLTSTWGVVKNFTWGQSLAASLAIVSARQGTGSGPQRKFVKLSKSLRFRQIYYRVGVNTDGSTNTAPVKLFGLTTFVRAGERAVKTIS